MTLTAYEWVATMAGYALLVAVIAWLLKDKIQRVEADHKAEVVARAAGDSELTTALAAITKSLREISDSNLREHGAFALARDVGDTHRRLYEGIEEIKQATARIEARMVTQEQCHARCVNAS